MICGFVLNPGSTEELWCLSELERLFNDFSNDFEHLKLDDKISKASMMHELHAHKHIKNVSCILTKKNKKTLSYFVSIFETIFIGRAEVSYLTNICTVILTLCHLIVARTHIYVNYIYAVELERFIKKKVLVFVFITALTVKIKSTIQTGLFSLAHLLKLGASLSNLTYFTHSTTKYIKDLNLA